MKLQALVQASLLALAALVLPDPVFSEPSRCDGCNMLVDENSRFSSKIDENGKTRRFCDIGDLLQRLGEQQGSRTRAFVKDYGSGEWIPAAKAFFVHAPKRFSTPMGWSIAAFARKSDGEQFGTPLPLDDILKLVH